MRIVALSDQHGQLPRVPSCDLLIVAGDVCPDGMGGFDARTSPVEQWRWFERRVRPWAAAVTAGRRILTWGNHDWCGEVEEFWSTPDPAEPGALEIVVDREVQVPRPGRAPLRVWATPWSNRFMDWAFMKEPRDLVEVYAKIPAGIDILVSHQPPYGFGDRFPDRHDHVGSEALRDAIDRVRPRLVICGHIHGGRGRYEYDGIPIYNVSILDDDYRPAFAPTVIELD